MQISRQEAGLVISKWFNERTPLTLLLVSGDSSFTIKLSGFINGFSSRIVVSDGTPDKSSNPSNAIVFPADFVDSFKYEETKSLGLPQEAVQMVTNKPEFASLSLTYESGDRLTIFER